jgi:hypothetical protein
MDYAQHVRLLNFSLASRETAAGGVPRLGNKQPLIAIMLDRWGLTPPDIETDGSRT